MSKSDKVVEKTTSKRSKKPPAITEEGRENQLIALAVDLAEQQLRDGTATSQVITHYLKLGSTKERLDKKNLEMDVKLKQAKIDALERNSHIEELYTKALDAMRRYRGEEITDGEEDV